MVARLILPALVALAACAPDPPPPPAPTAEGASRPTTDTSNWQRAPTPAASTLRGTNLAPNVLPGTGSGTRRFAR